MASEHVFPLKEDISHLDLLQEIYCIAAKVICMVSFSMNFGKYEYHTEWTMYEERVDGLSIILDWITFFIYFNSPSGGSGVGWWAIATDFFLWIPDTLYKLWGQQQ